jgi:hypothetical protein
MRKGFNELLVNPNKCSALMAIYIDTKDPSNMVQDAIVDLKTGDLDAAIQKLGIAKAILAES